MKKLAKKAAKRKTAKKVTKRKPATCKPKRKVRNPEKFLIKLKLTQEEIGTLEILKTKYESARILLDAYDFNTDKFDANIVAIALLATKDDGGGFYIVPGISKEFSRKLQGLFRTVEDHIDELDINTQVELSEVL